MVCASVSPEGKRPYRLSTAKDNTGGMRASLRGECVANGFFDVVHRERAEHVGVGVGEDANLLAVIILAAYCTLYAC